MAAKFKLSGADYSAWVANNAVVLNDVHEFVRIHDVKIPLESGHRLEGQRDYLRHVYFTKLGKVFLQRPNNVPLESVAKSPFTARAPTKRIVKTEFGLLEYREPPVCFCRKTWKKEQGEEFDPVHHHETCVFADFEPPAAPDDVPVFPTSSDLA